MPHLRFATSALLAAALAWVAAPAAGQVQVQNGNAHDANPRVGSGGQNRVENQINFAQRNLLITNQVAGGRGFRDTVDFIAPGQFGDVLGSDDLFGFRQESALSSPQALGIQSQRYNTLGANVVFTQNTTQLTGFQGSPQLGRSSRTVFDTRSGVLSFNRNNGGLITVPGLDNPGQRRGLASLGTVRTQDGGFATVNTSPLNGIQINPLQPDRFRFDPSPAPQTPQDTDLSPAVSGRLEPVRAWENPADGDAAPDESMVFINGRPAPAMILGNQIQQQLAGQLREDESRDLGGSVARLNDFILGTHLAPADPDQAPENPYEAILQQIREQANHEMPGQGPDTDGGVDKPAWQRVLEDPDEALLDAIERAKDDAVRRMLGLVDENGAVDRDVPLPEVERSSELAQLLDNLNYNLPRVGTLSGEDRQARHNKMLVHAEQHLADGQYLSAENAYRQILREARDNPLAKAGLIHAQLGGGMVRSAAFNLRALFTEHPELIALQYDENLLPSAERLRWLQRELQEMIDKDIHSAEPGLILAYLGYQLNAEPLVQYGLSVAQERTPRDPLMPLLDRIWREQAGDQDQGE